MATAQATPLTGRTAWARNLAAPVRDFLSTETGSAIVLLVATVAALLWANSPWPDSYESVWTTELSIRLGDWALTADLREWVNDGLMTFFFLVVGLEAKRELDLGELRDRKRLALPVVAGLGGMVVPVAIYLAFNAGGTGAHGWGAAMSTDTAFALGPAGAGRAARRHAPARLPAHAGGGRRPVRAARHRHRLQRARLADRAGHRDRALRRALAPALRAGRALGGRGRGGRRHLGRHVQVGHPSDDRRARDRAGHERLPAVARRPRARQRELPVLPRAATPELARTAQLDLTSAISANERLQYRLHPWTSYAIVPLFALSNAGITFSGGLLGDALRSPVTLGIVVGYVVGKPAGIVGASWLATRRVFGGQRLPVSWPGLAGIGAVAGIGFTVSLLISSIAFHGRLLEEAKIGILAGAVLSALSAWGAFRLIALIPADRRGRASSAAPPTSCSTSPRTSTPRSTTCAATTRRP